MPTIFGSPPTAIAEGTPYSFTPTASDPDRDPLTFRISGKPSWATFDGASGRLSGTPGLTAAGSYADIVISASDGRSKASLPPFTITVTQTNQVPIIGGTPSVLAVAGQLYSFTPTASDPDGDKLSYGVSNKPSWLNLDVSTGTLSGVPPLGGGTTTATAVTLTVTDGKLSAQLTPFDIRLAQPAGTDQPRGLYSLDKIVDLPHVAGFAVRVKWEDMEPIEGKYDFSAIESAVRGAAAIGQGVTITSLVNFVPSWMLAKTSMNAGSQYMDIKGESAIVPWDEAMLVAMGKLAAAQANHKVDGIALKDHPTVKQVHASIAGVTAIRLLPVPPGYTYDKFSAAVERSIGYWASAYPSGKHLFVGLFSITDSPRQSPTTAEMIRENLLRIYDGTSKQRIHFFQDLLTGQRPSLDGPGAKLLVGVQSRAGVMFQACGPWVSQYSSYWSCAWILPSDSPQLGFDLAYNNFGTVYYEFYSEDLASPTYKSQFEAMKAKIYR